SAQAVADRPHFRRRGSRRTRAGKRWQPQVRVPGAAERERPDRGRPLARKGHAPGGLGPAQRGRAERAARALTSIDVQSYVRRTVFAWRARGRRPEVEHDNSPSWMAD